MSGDKLHVIALISGGKDSFYSLLHCIHHGHRIVALANLFPSSAADGSTAVRAIEPGCHGDSPSGRTGHHEHAPCVPEKDLNSFMYQTVGHDIIPLYASATRLPLYRQAILGTSLCRGRDYDYASVHGQGPVAAGDETESMLPLLRAVMARHPDANALCSGAILSTYQRTRVESVALRLGLAPLSYLWKYPLLPSVPGAPADEAQLLRDMAAAGVEARIIKVASAGLDEHHLWERVTSETGVRRVKAALRKFGAAEGASLGEGGEFETIVVDGPAILFKKRIAVPVGGRSVVSEGGGSAWLMLRGAKLEDKPVQEPEPQLSVRVPGLLGPLFQSVADSLDQPAPAPARQAAGFTSSKLVPKSNVHLRADSDTSHWVVAADPSAGGGSCIHAETINVVDKIKLLLSTNGLEPCQITSVIILLRSMADFASVNTEYGKLFTRPNPPSRITVSCGDLLPPGRNIVSYMTAPVANARVARTGLHVQSRSYWAPANIGPYSQAIETAVSVDGEPTGLRSVLISGQIPLLPASMALPPASKTSVQEQIVLSLQHLWRIGAEMKVQCWSSATAYFARQHGDSAAQKSTMMLAGRAWKLAHGSPDDDDDGGGGGDDDDGGPDLWDLKYNKQFRALGPTETETSCPSIPDWSAYTLRQQNEPGSCIPPVFAAEVESLPRGSLVEWHAHNGLKNIEAGSVELIHFTTAGTDGTGGWQSWHMTVKAGENHVVFTAMAYPGASHDGAVEFDVLQRELGPRYQESMHRLQPNMSSPANLLPYLGYVDLNRTEGLWRHKGGAGIDMAFAVVPCHSIWGPTGQRLTAVAFYKAILTASDVRGMEQDMVGVGVKEY
ncbi:Rossmann-like alpha/beta/alpha sandwich fold protein [Metarhizium album ARSEF 1941]|uniref:Diphthine--ammonia ligase n=1 Tax=Metarhizium album (strain ARSEF 1941) TaxID=1081103 RepID=A0A0B2WS18_METAS|nr:Rossmann-like alpha/beta/alpha sandwich fold protein [Metarhizium album ARSEF 1941]KHN96272.1 Rossmann-like alpha/beta/alpha sandwich fold protein [Metarhizium album ARSEF 1941]